MRRTRSSREPRRSRRSSPHRAASCCSPSRKGRPSGTSPACNSGARWRSKRSPSFRSRGGEAPRALSSRTRCPAPKAPCSRSAMRTSPRAGCIARWGSGRSRAAWCWSCAVADIRVRLAGDADDALIGEILVDGYVTAYARKMPHVVVGEGRRATLRDVASKREHATVLVVEVDGRVCGTVSIWKPGDADSEAWVQDAADLRHLAVAPEMQGRGLARPLLDEAERIARDEWKAGAICLHVRHGNAGVARLYQSRGYVRSPSGDLSYPDIDLDAYVLRFR